MTPDQAKASYRRLLDQFGRISVRRYSGTGPTRTFVDYPNIRARDSGYDPSELVGGILQGDRRVIVLADDVTASGLPLPLTNNDALVIRGREVDIQAVDDATRRVGDVLIAYEIRVRG